MSSSYQQLSPVIGATAAVALGAAYMMYRSKAARCPLRQREGHLAIADMSATDERKRDLYRFYKSQSIYLKTRGGECHLFKAPHDDGTPDSVIRDLVKQLPKGTDLDALVYALSTSLGMDVLLKLGVMPPIISQPVLVVSVWSGEVDLWGFLGTELYGDRPDRKFSDWLARITVRTNGHNQRIGFHVKPRTPGSDRTTDFI